MNIHFCFSDGMRNFAPSTMKKKAMVTKSKIVVFREAGTPLQVETCDIPALKEGEVLVKNEYATLCRSDISTYLGKRIEKSPTILGHEIVGRVAALGPGVTDADGKPLHVGERVTWAIYAADPSTELSRRGIPQKSPDLFKYGHERLTPDSTLHGGLAEYTLLRKHTPILPLDESVPLPVGSIINCAISTVVGSLRLAGELRGRQVAIWGIGMLGIIACAICKERGAGEIVAIDINRERLALAGRFGATSTHLPDDKELEGLQADVTIDYSGRVGSMEATVGALAIGGVAVWVGGVCPQEKVKIDSEMLIRRLGTIKGLHNYNGDDFREAVAFVSRCWQKYPIEELIYDGFPLDRAEEAFRYAIEHNPFRVGIRTN